MKELQRLVKIIDNNTTTSSPLINLQDESTLEVRLFHLLKNSTTVSEEDVAHELYGSQKLTGSYRTLKFRFRKKLYNHLHFLDYNVDDLSSAHDVIYVCYSLLTEGQALMMYSEYKAAQKIYEQVMQVARKYENIEMKILALEGIRNVYHALSKYKEWINSGAELNSYYKIQACERESLQIYDRTILSIRGHVSQKNELLETFPATLKLLWELWEQSGSSRIFFQRHVLQIAYHEQLGEYAKILDAIALAEKLVTEKQVNMSWYNRKYNAYVEVYALLQCRQYERGLELASENITLFIKFSSNWFAFMENYMLLAIHSSNYKIAGDLLTDIIESDHLRKLGDSTIERWELYRRYLVFIIEHKVGEQSEVLRSEITNELMILPKDKAGFNQALLVLEVLQKLADNRVDDLDVQAERVRKYVQKYLRGEKAERPRLFMRLLLLTLTKSSPMARQQGQNLLERLQETPLPGDAFTEVEIVPYEHLWELALQLLQQREKGL